MSATSETPSLHLFDAFGVELEYMLVRRDNLAVLPRTDDLLAAVAGEVVSDLDMGELSWSNELVLHVVELKTTAPAPRLEVLADLFQHDVRRINELLEPLGGRLMPTAMHPWMDPLLETRLWPHDYSPVYQAYDRIFGCRGHGWSNLQSAHLNLPFTGDAEFGRLHAGIRLLLPLLPALAASSPIVEGRGTGLLDNRMEFYRLNSRRIPEVCAEVIPEPAFSEGEYQRQILQPLYRAIEPFDPEGVLRFEFLNSRGAIARFDRGSIEIRVIDVQECPQADLAVVAASVGVLQALAAERWSSLADQQAMPAEPLAKLLRRVIRDADAAPIDDPAYLGLFGLDAATATAGELWQHLHAELLRGVSTPPPWARTLERMIEHGPLARRLLRVLGNEPEHRRLMEVYGQLCDCLEGGELFVG